METEKVDDDGEDADDDNYSTVRSKRKRLSINQSINQFISHSICKLRRNSSVKMTCARSMYAISVLRSHGMETSALQQAFRAVISKLTYAAPAW